MQGSSGTCGAKFNVLFGVPLCIAVQVKKEKQSRTSQCLPTCTDSVGLSANEQAVIKVSDERITLMSVRLNARSG